MGISAQEAVNTRKKEDWDDLMNAWLDDPQTAADHMVFGMDINQRQTARMYKSGKSVPTWV